MIRTGEDHRGRGDGGFAGMLARQLRADLAAMPALARARLREGARAERCLSIAELRTLCARRLPRPVFDYVDGAAGDELTARRNLEDLRELRILPRVLAGVPAVDLSTTVLWWRPSSRPRGRPATARWWSPSTSRGRVRASVTGATASPCRLG